MMQTRFMKRAVCGAVAVAALLAAGAAQAVAVPGQGTWETTLLPRDLDGNAVNGPEAFYDTALNITWLRNANVNGLMDWTTANAWANTLVVNGVSGWRLPTNEPLCGGYNCTRTEMGHLWYVALGNIAFPQPGWGLTNTGNFQSLRSYYYWFGTEYAPNPGTAWHFSVVDGYQQLSLKTDSLFALAVRPGDVAAVIPEPQTCALMLMGLSALVLTMRRRPR